MPQVEFVVGIRTWTAKEYKALIRLNNYVHDLQPGASDLEELLRKAELDKLHYCIAMCLLYEHELDGFDSLITHLRADEEKARATIEKR